MGVYVNLRCRSCGTSLTGGYVRDYSAIGEPFVECRSCGTANSHAHKCTEWALMGSFRKACLLVRAALSVLFYAIAIFMLFVVIIVGMKDMDVGPGGFVVAAAAALLISFIYRVRQIRRLIRQSNERMGNPAYQMKLRLLGMAR